ncbi:MAG TPA: DNA repair protein RadC [Thermoanaerobaculia bacterium]|nr:DNA repair protein RadC [Thermoanaerobaculia bacterium]
MTYLIRDVPVESRPRERLLAHGPEVLSDAELLAIILGTGAPGKNAIHLAQELLEGGMPNLRHRGVTALAGTRGVGPAKVARIAAVIEMARRMAVPQQASPAFDRTVFGRKLVGSYGHQAQERLGAALLDSRHRITKQREIFVGTIDKAFVSTRDVVRFALMERATGVVVYHNHPSGDPAPSNEDLTFTHQLKQALATVDVELVDHLIIGTHRFHSMKERDEL